MLACLHKHGKMKNFGTVRSRIPFSLMWCKNYHTLSRLAKVIAKSLLPRLLCTVVYTMLQNNKHNMNYRTKSQLQISFTFGTQQLAIIGTSRSK